MTDAAAEIRKSKSAREPRPTKRKALPRKVENLVWARAAGRCQYAGCNRLLIGDQISGAANANTAYVGHIVADSPDGPRGDPIRSPLLAYDPDNLMLVCDVHHRVFDREMVADHPEEVLTAMKRRHEARIRTVTAIDENRGSHVIRYAARIGTNESPVAKGDLKWAMIPDLYPLDDGWIDLDLSTLDLPDHDSDFWRTHVRNLRTGFAEKVRGRMERQEVRRLSSRSLRDGVVVLGRNLDLATAVARHEARAWHSGVKPPSALIDLVKGENGHWEVEAKAQTRAQKRGEFAYVTLPPAEEELVDQTIDPSADFDPEAVL